MRARRETVLSAGAIGSPHILELSGVGRGDVLQAAGIDTVAEVQGVGENLQDHLQLRMVYKVSGVLTLNERASTLFGKARIGLEYALTRSGPMSMAPSQARRLHPLLAGKGNSRSGISCPAGFARQVW